MMCVDHRSYLVHPTAAGALTEDELKIHIDISPMIWQRFLVSGNSHEQVTFFSNGDDMAQDLQFYLNPQAEHLLDGFHTVPLVN